MQNPPDATPEPGTAILPGDLSGPLPTEPGTSSATGARIDAILDRIMSVHRPAVLAHLRGIRSRHPDASPPEVLRILERRYLTAVTTSGAGVGVAAAVPAVGTGAALALSGAETVVFLEATALFAQSVAELHGIPVDDPERGRALVLAMVIGGPAQELLTQFAGQASGRGPVKTEFWGTLIAKNLPRTVVAQFMDRVRKVYLPRMMAQAGGTVVGRVLPFGVGAVVGGAANQLLGRRVVKTARTAFGPPPYVFPASTTPKVVAPGPRPSRRAIRAITRAEQQQPPLIE
ncbi:hypothetical protein [Protaetiibacter larvae]|uniref:Di-and tripeptidase n=1 Tax=Protaetiibacter larvae TaxID=2592654 RepID=A0A5C1YB48_9MICO|nr:hypothetical protein [Protaetiibacter larvae]QEO10485.1 hypothetical protein FLP23_11000 [Protaetiibacter larvae]